MRTFINIILILFYSQCFSQNSISRTLLNDDFGGYQFTNELVEVLTLAENKKIKTIEFELIENRLSLNDTSFSEIYSPNSGERSPEFTKMLCKLTSDSTITMIKEYKHGTTCYISGYNMKFKKGIYCLTGTFTPSTTTDSCISITDDSLKFPENITLLNSADTIILKRIKYDTATVMKGKFDKDFHLTREIVIKELETYYFDTKTEKLLKINYGQDYAIDSRLFNYPLIDSTVIFTTQDDGFKIIEKKKSYKTWKSKNELLYTETSNITTSYISKMTGEETTSVYPDETVQTLYKFNKQNMPVEIKVVESTNYGSKVKGSILTINYASPSTLPNEN
ncbi:MAG: hypothetical protein HYU68_06995 [Bacteroidetes bacterium]|nr:hypothetical protein [Bacteroidota bacterium]